MTASSRLAIVIGVTQMLAWATSFYVPAIAIPAIAADLGVSPMVMFGGFSWALLVSGLCAPRTGRWIERAGGRDVLALGAALMGTGLLAMAATPARSGWLVPVWYGAWTIEGVGMALGLYDAAFATIGWLLGAQARPAIVGTTMIAGFASTFGWSAGSAIIFQLGWRGTLLVYAAVQIIALVPAILVLLPAARAYPPRVQNELAVARETGGQPTAGGRVFFLLALFLVLRSAVSSVVFVHLLVLLHGLGLGAAAAVVTASLIGPCQVGMRVVDWMFGRGLNPLTGARLGSVLLPLGAAGILAGLPAWSFAALYGLSNGMLTITRGVLPLYLFGPRGYATLLGRLALPQLVIQAAMPTLTAPFVLIWPAWVVFAAITAVSAAALFCLMLLRTPAGVSGRAGSD